ncbi:MAG: FHA domain-containing protein [Myxococcota bacterium]
MIRISIVESGKSPQLLTFNASAITLGRTSDNDLCLTGKGVSGTHCRIIREGETYFIEDLGSTNGTYVNRHRVQGRQPLGSTDDVVLAVYRLRVLADSESSASFAPMSAPPSVGQPPSDGGHGGMAATPVARHAAPTAQVPAPAGAIPGSMPGSIPGGAGVMPGSMPSMPGSMPSMPGSTPSMPGSMPSMPGSMPSMPGSTPSMPGSTPSMPGATPSMPGGAPSMPGGAPSMPGALPPVPGGTPPVPAGQLPATEGGAAAAAGGLKSSGVAWEREWDQIDKLAMAWLAAGKDGSALLRGEKLSHARKWLAQGRGKHPAPKPLHRDFIMAGGRAAAGRLVGRLLVVLLVLGAAGVGGWYLYSQREDVPVEDDGDSIVQAEVPDVGGGTAPVVDGTRSRERSDQLAAVAGGLFERDPVLALLVAVEAVDQLPRDRAALDAPAFALLRGALRLLPGRPLRGHTHSVEAVALSPNGRWAITAEGGRAGDIRLWDLFEPGILESKFLRGHPKGLTGMEVGRDGRWLVTADDDGLAMRWNLTEEDPSATGVRLEDHRAPITSLDISTDGRWLATGDEAGKVRVWDLNSPLPTAIKLLKGPELAITDVAINANGTRVIASSEDMMVYNWRLTDGRPGRPIVIPHEEVVVTAVALTDDDTVGVSGGTDGVVRLWPPTSRAPTRRWELLEQHKGAISLLEVTTDSSMAISIARDNDLVIWDLKAKDTAASSVRLPGHKEKIVTLDVFSPPAGVERHVPTSAFTASADGTARSWNLDKRKSGVESRVFAGHRGAVRSVAVSGDGLWVITGGDDRVARVWDWQSLPLAGGDEVDVGSASLIGRGHTDGVVAIGVDEYGRRMITGSADGTVRVWDLRHPTRLESMEIRALHEDKVRAVASSQRWAASGDDSGLLVIWNIQVDRPKGLSLAGHEGEIGAVAFSPDQTKMVSVSTDSTARVWRITQEDPENDVVVLPHTDEVSQLAISGDGRWLLTGTLTSAVLWELEGALTEAARRFSDHEDDLTAVGLGPNGRWAATGSADRKVVLYDLNKKGANAVKLRKHEDTIRTIAFGPRGRWLATGSDDKSIRLWNLRSEYPGEGSLPLTGHQGGITDLRWSPDGRWLVSASYDGTIRLWDVSKAEKNYDEMVEGAIILEVNGKVIRQIGLISTDDLGLSHVVSASYDGTARLWPLRADDLVPLGCTYAGRTFTKGEWKKYIGGSYDPACGV